MESERDTMNVLESLAALDLSNWTGLPGGISLEQAGERFAIDDDWGGTGQLGSARRQADWYAVEARGFPEGLRLWFSGPELILADARHPELSVELEELLAELGSPQARLDAYLGTLLIEGSEWVWADRGLTLYVNPANGRLLRVSVYRPCSLSDYEEALRLNLKRVRLPAPRRAPEGASR